MTVETSLIYIYIYLKPGNNNIKENKVNWKILLQIVSQKKKKKSAISQPLILPSVLRTERSYLIHAITLRGATTLCARLDIKARYAHFSFSLLPPPLIYDEAIEKSPRLSAILYPPTVLDATRFFRRLKVASSSTPFASTPISFPPPCLSVRPWIREDG